MPVEVIDESGDAASPALLLSAERAACAILESLSRGDDELSIVLVGDARIRELNRDWRGKDSATDVLSFSQLEGEEMVSATTLLGDVVVSVDTLRRQAADGGWSEEEELTRLLLHGVLHLLGFDHENDEDSRTMRAEEARVVAALAARGIDCAFEGEAP